MSGPFPFSLAGDQFDGPAFCTVPFAGFYGTLRLYVQPVVDSRVFRTYIGGKLRGKEVLCGKQRGINKKPKRSQTYVPVCDKVKP